MCGSIIQTLTLFQTKICNFPVPLFRPGHLVPRIHTHFCKNPYPFSDIKTKMFKNYTQIQTKRLKIHSLFPLPSWLCNSYTGRMIVTLTFLCREKSELWKKADAMEHEIKVKADDRWMEDSEVSHCLDCNAEFSFLLRKVCCD